MPQLRCLVLPRKPTGFSVGSHAQHVMPELKVTQRSRPRFAAAARRVVSRSDSCGNQPSPTTPDRFPLLRWRTGEINQRPLNLGGTKIYESVMGSFQCLTKVEVMNIAKNMCVKSNSDSWVVLSLFLNYCHMFFGKSSFH